MADQTTLDEAYLTTRQATDQWQAQMLNQQGSGETVKLHAEIPPKEPTPDVPGGTRTDAEIDQLLQESKQRNVFQVESPEVQAIRQTAKEHAAKLGTGELAAEKLGKVGRALAEALHPGIKVAGRALGLDEEGADALATGFVEFLGGLPGPDEGDAMAGVETALAALPMIGMAMKTGKVTGKAAKKLFTQNMKTPITWEEAIGLDESYKAFEEGTATFNKELSVQRQGVRSDVQVAAESRSPEALTMEAFLDLPPGTILKDSNVVAAKQHFKTLAEPLRLKAQALAANPGDQQLLISLLQEIPRVRTGTLKIAGVFAEPPRSTRQLNKDYPTGGMIPAQSEERVRISDPYINQWLEFFKQQDHLAQMGAPALTAEKLVGLLAQMQSPEEFVAAAKVLANPSKWDMFVEYWINGLLSGPQTHATNILSNAATLAWGIPERAIASMLSSSVRPSESLAMMGGILEAQGDAFALAWKAFKAEESQLGLGKMEGPTRAITADALELTGIPGRAVDLLGAMIRLPGRALLASDDYFKSIAFRAELRAMAKRTAFQEVTQSGLSGKAARLRMSQIEERILASPPDSIDAAAKEFAAYVTFTRELGETGQKVQQALSTPIGRIFVPFVRTPTNIFKFAGERTPLAFASQAVRDEIAAGGDRRALALAKISLGAMTMGYTGMLASEGIIEGGGPKDKALRQIWLDAGHLPYSVRVGDTRYSFSRIEPVGSLLGVAADVADIIAQLPDNEAEDLAASVVVAIQRNVANKTFIKGLSGALNAVSSQDINVVKTFFEKELPTILPYSTGGGQLARELDPVMREVNSILDAYKAKIPGLSDTLPPRRNLWGEPIFLQGGLGPDMITPIYTSQVKHDPVSDELVRLQVPISMPSKTIEGVPLNPEEYDGYVVLQGAKPIIGGITLKERLAETMHTDLYKRASGGPEGGKSVLLRQWINAYREQARQIMDQPSEARRYLGHDFPDLQLQRTDKRAQSMQQFNAPVETR